MDDKNAKKLISTLEDINKTLAKIEKNTRKEQMPLDKLVAWQMPGESEESIREVTEELRKTFGDTVDV